MPVSALLQPLHKSVGRRVLLAERIDRRVGDLVLEGDEVAEAVAVDGDAEAYLGLDLVALGDGDLAHVVAETRDLHAPHVVPCGGGAHPDAEPLADRRFLPVPDHHLAIQAKPRADEAEFAVAVSRLVEVHEVHVDGRPRDVAVELRVQMTERLGEPGQAPDPHLGRAEGVHPRDETDAIGLSVRVAQRRGDLVGGRDHRLEHELDRQPGPGVEPGDDLPGVGRDLLQRLGAVKVLAAGDEPDFKVGKVDHGRSRFSPSAGARPADGDRSLTTVGHRSFIFTGR